MESPDHMAWGSLSSSRKAPRPHGLVIFELFSESRDRSLVIFETYTQNAATTWLGVFELITGEPRLQLGDLTSGVIHIEFLTNQDMERK